MRLRMALEREMPTDAETRNALEATLERIFGRETGSRLAKTVPGVARYTLAQLDPMLRAELDRRIFAGVDLIRLNRAAAVEKTLQRFAGWTSSVPTVGSTQTDLRAVVREIAKPAKQVRFEARRVAIDQGFKLSAAVSHVVAMNSGAIAATWHDVGEWDPNYDARPDHLARSGRLFLVKDSWAMTDGLVKRGSFPYTESVTQPAQEVYCSCFWTWITSLRDLPAEALTAKGRLWLAGDGARSA